MKNIRWQVFLGLALLISSAVFYLLHYFIFKDAHHIFLYLIGDIAFVFIEVLLVTMILHQLLSAREKRSKMEKLNMVIGTFFSEVGTGLLVYLSNADPKLDSIKKDLIVTNNWSEKEFTRVHRRLKEYDYRVDIHKLNLNDLRFHLIEKRDFLLRLLENPVLLEHESFTELLRAVFHLTEELQSREETEGLPETDYQHLGGDIKRAYSLLVNQWFDYMKYLKTAYPYLFSLAIRTNPFDKEASPIVR
jgi:hypothetical protein